MEDTKGIVADLDLMWGDVHRECTRLQERIKARIMVITPDLAKQWLEKNKLNRRLSAVHAKRLSRDITAGRWVFTGLPIVFDSNGDLVNGQHTLTAVVDAGTPIVSLVVSGVEPKALFAFDDGKRRSFADLCVIHGKEHVACIQSITRVVLRYERGAIETPGVCFSIGEQEDCLQRNPDIEDAARFVGSNKSLRAVIQPSVSGFVRWHTNRINPEKSSVFFAGLATGIGLDQGDPILLLREGLRNAQTASKKIIGMDSKYVLAITIKAWNGFIKGQKMRCLRWRSDGPQPEKFPEFIR